MALRHPCRVRHLFQAPENRSFGSPLLLVILTTLFFVLGVSFLPSSSQPASIPDSPTLSVTFQGPPPPQQLSILSFLMQTGSSDTELVVEASGRFSPGQAVVDWTAAANGFTGFNCTPKSQQITLTSLGNDNYDITSKSPTRPFGSLFFGFNLCWQDNSPLAISGPYISAELPSITSTVQTGTVTRSLELIGTSLSGYALAGGLAPTKVTPMSWTWTSSLSPSFENTASASIPVIGSSISGLQNDSNEFLIAGIMFGVAGGAFVSIFPALFDAFDRRKATLTPPADEDPPCQDAG